VWCAVVVGEFVADVVVPAVVGTFLIAGAAEAGQQLGQAHAAEQANTENNQSEDHPNAQPTQSPPEAVQDLLTRTTSYRGRAKDRDYTGPDTPEEEFGRLVDPKTVRNHPNYGDGKLGDVPGGGTAGLRPTSRDTQTPSIDLHNIPGLPKTVKVKWPLPQ
jgi:hypothetical protein